MGKTSDRKGGPVRAAVYVRVSTDEQRTANQEPACIRACEARGWTCEVFRETEGGAARVRPVWAAVLELARRGEIGAVVVYSISRIGRRRTDIAADLANLIRWGAAVVSVRESFLDVGGGAEMSPAARLCLEIFAWFAEAEKDEIIDRTNAALTLIKSRLAEKGHYVARSGRRITSLGRPGFAARWRDRARELAAVAGPVSALQISRALRAEGAPEIHPRTVAGWIWPPKGRAA